MQGASRTVRKWLFLFCAILTFRRLLTCSLDLGPQDSANWTTVRAPNGQNKHPGSVTAFFFFSNIGILVVAVFYRLYHSLLLTPIQIRYSGSLQDPWLSTHTGAFPRQHCPRIPQSLTSFNSSPPVLPLTDNTPAFMALNLCCIFCFHRCSPQS